MKYRDIQEFDIEVYFLQQVAAHGAIQRKVQWVGRRDATDRVVMAGHMEPPTIWVELKKPGADMNTPHVRAQLREHDKLRKAGQTVVVLDSKAAVDYFFSWAFPA